MGAEDSDRVQFDRRSARRIAGAVHTVERTPQSRRGPFLQPIPIGTPGIAIVKLTGTSAVSGVYLGQVMAKSTTSSNFTSGALGVADVVGDTSAAEVYLMNPMEIGSSTHLLTSTAATQVYFAAIPDGTADDQKPKYMLITPIQWEFVCGVPGSGA